MPSLSAIVYVYRTVHVRQLYYHSSRLYFLLFIVFTSDLRSELSGNQWLELRKEGDLTESQYNTVVVAIHQSSVYMAVH